MKLSIKATNGDKNYDYTISKEEWMKLAGLAFDAEVQGQKEAKTETKKAGGCVSSFLHAYGVTTELDARSIEAGNDSAFPEDDGDLEATCWLVAWNHSSGRKQTYESKLAQWEKKVTALAKDFMEFGATPEAARAKAETKFKKPEAAKA
jgi:hypothetical protein